MTALLLLLSAPAVLTGRVVGVHDGDSITVLVDRQPVKVRLWGIDCPELGQPYGTRAKQYTSSLCFGQAVTLRLHGRDRYRRTLAEVILPDGKCVNVELLRAGLAWRYKYTRRREYGEHEAAARAARRGLWADKEPVPPWEWRKRKQAK